MLLAVDIGNSTISTGLFGLDGELRFLASLDTDYRKTADQICVDLMNLFQLYHFRYEDVTDSILCSVVPPLNFMMEKALTRLLGKPPVVVGPGVKTGLNIRLAVQSQVGADIVADAVSALEQFTAPIITIDMGTATTVTAVDADGAFRGGAIIPGKSTVILYANEKKPTEKCVVPTLLGRTPSEANTVAVNAGLLIRFSGTTGSESSSIRVLSQNIEAGTEVDAGTVITVQLGDTSVTD